MALKIFKAVWFLSLLASIAIFLYVYASLPETVLLQEAETPVTIARDYFFYVILGFLALINTLVFVYNRFGGKQNPDLASWISGLVICINFFMIITLSYVNLYNSLEKFDYSRLGVVIYGSVALIVLWVAGWPVYQFSKKYFIKEQV